MSQIRNGRIILKNYAGELGSYSINPNKPLAEELVRVILDESLILEEGDILCFEIK